MMKLTRDKVIEIIEKGESLAGLDLSGLDLSNIDFAYAQKEHFNLYDTDLTEANLQNTKGLREHHLAGSDLTNCQLPYELTTTDFKLKIAEESSKNARKIFFGVLLGALYCALTIAATKDVDLFTKALSSTLPIVQSNINIVWFYIFAPFSLVGGYFYFHLYLLRLWENLASLPAIFPDGDRLDQKTYPWLLNGMLIRHLRQLRKKPPVLSLWQYLASLTLGWMVVPFTLYLFWARYLGKHDPYVTGIHLFLLASAVAVGVTFFLQMVNSFKKLSKNEYQYKRIKCKNRVILTFIFLLCFSLFSFLSYKAFLGFPYDFHIELKSFPKWQLIEYVDKKLPGEFLKKRIIKTLDGKPDQVYFVTNDENTLRRQLLEFEEHKKNEIIKDFKYFQSRLKDLEVNDFNVFVSWVLKYISHPFVDLFQTNLSTKPLAWQAQENNPLLGLIGIHLGENEKGDLKFSSNNDLSQVKGIELDNANLRFANLSGSFLVKGSLKDADLFYANLTEADLREASLQRATLENANLSGATIKNARLVNAILENATFSNANLENADLSDATLGNAYLGNVNLENATLSNANLENADLGKTNFKGATLKNANFTNAVLWETDFRNTDQEVGISQEQLNSAAKQGCYPIGSISKLGGSEIILQKLIKKGVINKEKQLYCFQELFNNTKNSRKRLERTLEINFKSSKSKLLRIWDLSHKSPLLPCYLDKNNCKKNEKVNQEAPVSDKTPQKEKKK